MNIFFLVFLLVALLICAFATNDEYNTASNILFSICVAIILWGAFAVSNHEQKNKFVCKTPVYIQDKIAFSVFKNQLINCSDKFNAQFKQGDSICVFEEIDTWTNGIKWSGEDYLFRLDKDGKK